VNEFPG